MTPPQTHPRPDAGDGSTDTDDAAVDDGRSDGAKPTGAATNDGRSPADAAAALLDPLAIGRDDHLNAPAFVVRGDEVADALTLLRDRAGFDHCSCVTAQQYASRYETIYHLRTYEDPTEEVSVVVPAAAADPETDSGAAAFTTADWHEREAYDLFGIRYRDHPDLRRILLPETWQGHPLSRDYDGDQSQIVPLTESERLRGDALDPASTGGVGADTGGAEADTDGAEADAGGGGTDAIGAGTDATGGGTETMMINLGPHHPATHGVLHLKALLDGETVVDVEPDIGYIHRCEEQMAQSGTYRRQIMPYPDRWDWGGGGLLNEWAYARAAEDLAGVDVPDYAQVVRTLGAELSRVLSHLLAVGTYALDVIGEFTAAFMYAIRERERVQSLLEDLTGQRLMFNYLRLGGVVWGLPQPREAWLDDVRAFAADLPERVAEFRDLLTENEIIQLRTVDTGVLPADVARDYGCTGPVARGSGIDYDLRRDDPYGWYDELDWDVVTREAGDNFARLSVRLGELEESARIVTQCADLLADWPEDERTVQSNVPRTLRPDADAEIYRTVEAAKGELGVYIRSDGTETPARFKIRGPSFSNLQALPEMARGESVADLIATVGSLDTIMGEVDR